MRDETGTIASLNCPNFAAKCKWANTNDEELDWTTLQAVPNPDRFLSLLDGENYPDPAAGVLTSPQRPGWEGGQLISDPLPCLPYGIRVTATAWKTQNGPIHDQPKLQVCSKNVAEVRFPLVNCNEFEVRNGEPVTVEVPAANNPNQPAHIVFYGNNFVAAQGGAIFLQDIVVEGTLTCSGGGPSNNNPVLINEGDTFRRQPVDEQDAQQLAASYAKTYDSAGPFKDTEGLSTLEELVESPGKNSEKFVGPLTSMSIHPSEQNSVVQSFAAERSPPTPPTPAHPFSPGLFESCLELSCNPSAQKFLVAPFMDPKIKSYTLVSEALNIPLMEPVYFCFNEYVATQGLSLSVCTDRMDCFYRKDTLQTGNTIDENKKWNVRCVKLPVGTYELRVIAENNGENKGEIGFLPIRLAYDPAGQKMIC
ncbi:hypothetical protein GCK32_006493 [Trichostrongylus colubriformis]|uniref:MAM domain-containing protein n=1 Tax=Trichostrongylus colubriformis TaxID=6319 RepID=A0AAN8ETK7_TRICO